MFTISGCKFERNWYSKDIVCRRLISLCCPFSAGGIFILAAILIPVKGCKKIVAETEGLGIENKHNQLPNNFAFGLGFNYILFTSSLTFSGNLPFFPFLSLSFWWKKPSHSKTNETFNLSNFFRDSTNQRPPKPKQNFAQNCWGEIFLTADCVTAISLVEVVMLEFMLVFTFSSWVSRAKLFFWWALGGF